MYDYIITIREYDNAHMLATILRAERVTLVTNPVAQKRLDRVHWRYDVQGKAPLARILQACAIDDTGAITDIRITSWQG